MFVPNPFTPSESIYRLWMRMLKFLQTDSFILRSNVLYKIHKSRYISNHNFNDNFRIYHTFDNKKVTRNLAIKEKELDRRKDITIINSITINTKSREIMYTCCLIIKTLKKKYQENRKKIGIQRNRYRRELRLKKKLL